MGWDFGFVSWVISWLLGSVGPDGAAAHGLTVFAYVFVFKWLRDWFVAHSNLALLFYFLQSIVE